MDMTRRSTIERIDLDKIIIDPRVQRTEGINQRHLDEIAENFNPDAMGVLILSRRPDGTYVILDGMHRRGAAMQVGYHGAVDAIVFEGLALPVEASLFLLYNNKKDPSAISRFNARVLSEDPVALAVHSIASDFGWTIRQATSTGSLVAVDALERVYRTAAGTRPVGDHDKVLRSTLGTITDAWGREPGSVASPILLGLGQLYGRFGTTAVDAEKLVNELQGVPPRQLVGKASMLRDSQGGTVPAALAKYVVGLHNKGRRTNVLPDWVWVR